MLDLLSVSPNYMDFFPNRDNSLLVGGPSVSEYSGTDLSTVDLIVDAVYSGYKTDKGGIADPLVKLVGVSRQGGFRYRGSKESPTLLVLTSNLSEPDWPDELDETTGRFTYYGDNREPGRLLHETPRFGNRLLKVIFDLIHCGQRDKVPPVLIFTTEGSGRSFRFRGLAVPGHPTLPASEDLIAIWKTTGVQRFQNYRAIFTILDEAIISREWVNSIGSGVATSCGEPKSWQSWVMTGSVNALLAPRTLLIRSKAEQLPSSEEDRSLIEVIRNRYREDPTGFEVCAGAITRLLLPEVSRIEITRPWRDGGRDGIGTLRLGQGPASINVVFALEAKCYSPTNSVGVREVSRLISRIKNREFGVLVTTSYVDKQAYAEVIDDGHPVILVTASDIVRLLRCTGYSSPTLVESWMAGFSKHGSN